MQTVRTALAVLEQNGEYLLQQRTFQSERGATGRLGLFGGKLEAGETAAACMIRELCEETTLTADDLQPSPIGSVTVTSDYRHQPVTVEAAVYRIELPPSMTVKVRKGEGSLVRLTAAEARDRLAGMTPATRAVFEQLL